MKTETARDEADLMDVDFMWGVASNKQGVGLVCGVVGGSRYVTDDLRTFCVPTSSHLASCLIKNNDITTAPSPSC